MKVSRKKKRSHRPIRLMTLDTETRGLFGEVFRVGLFDGEKYHVGNSFEDVKHVILHYSIDYDVHVYIHNLDFDVSKLAETLVPNVDFEKCIFINNNVAVFTTTINNAMTDDEEDLKQCPVVFHDSFKILPSSLADLCKSFGLKEDEKKVDLSEHIKSLGWSIYDSNGVYNKEASEGYYFEHVDPEEDVLNHYLEYDCRSLYKILMMTLEISELEIEDFVSCPTVAALAMKVFQKRFEKDYKKAISTIYRGHDAEYAETFIREGYYGGRTEVFIPSLDSGFHYDVNSLYPYVMKTYEYPIGDYEILRGADAEEKFRMWLTFAQQGITAGGGFVRADVVVPESLHIPPLPKRHGGKLLFPVGRLTGTWALPELKMAIDYGCEIKRVHAMVFFKKMAPIFREFVSYFEKIKTTSTGAKRQFAKLMQNSLYGKFGMRRERRTILPISAKGECEKEGKMYIELTHPILKQPFIETTVTSQAAYIQPHIAAYVTAYGRMVLYQALAEEKTGKKYYCDTDSIVSEKEFPENMVDDREYGKWAKENELEKGIYIQPKLYYERSVDGKEVIRAKGIPKEILRTWTEAQFDHIVNEIRNGADRVELFSGHKIRKKFVTILKNGEIFDSYQELRKGINLRAKQKRIMDFKNNYTRPHKIYDF